MKFMKTLFRFLLRAALLFMSLNLAFSCVNSGENPTDGDTAQEVTNAPIAIIGKVLKLTTGKDGYTADIQTETDGNYTALVSMINMGGPENFQSCAVGDVVTLKGVLSELGGAQQLTVTEIIRITSGLETKYRDIPTGAFCWQVSKEMQLHTQPDSGSKVEGSHFQGEELEVLGTKTVNGQLWVNVAYKLKVKAGYEDQFADGQVMSSGSPTGWIGGTEMPEINCK